HEDKEMILGSVRGGYLTESLEENPERRIFNYKLWCSEITPAAISYFEKEMSLKLKKVQSELSHSGLDSSARLELEVSKNLAESGFIREQIDAPGSLARQLTKFPKLH
ncbi:MAG: hypothetical protein WD876_03935, partial [Candidatus Pacearchaeota archaeon]